MNQQSVPSSSSQTTQEFHPASNSGTSNPRRTRITRACDTCRRKKIKCDVDTKHPCTTCRQYEWECTFHDTAKKRGPPKGYIESLETRLEKMEQLLNSIGSDTPVTSPPPLTPKQGHTTSKKRKSQHIEPLSPPSLPSLPESSLSLEADKNEITVNNSREKVVRYHGSSSGYYIVGDILSNDKPDDEYQQSNPHNKKILYMPSIDGGEPIRIRRMDVSDNDMMVVRDPTADEEARQDAFDKEELDSNVPRSVLVALVHTYFNNDHTTLPVLEKVEYMDAFEGRTTPPPAPLLTYAICTYSCFLLKSSDPVFRDAGVERDDIFKILLDRANVLVRREYLKPRIVTIQALLVMCTHPTYSTSSYRNWILAGMAVRMAQDLGLHRTITTVEVSERFKERRKKLWYSTYITDRWCCAVMGRPLAIADSDCDIDLPLNYGTENNDDMIIFVNFIKLSGILGEILRRIYSPKAKLNGYKTHTMEQTVRSLQKMLEEWFTNVPRAYKITETDLLEMRLNPLLYAGSQKITEGGPLTICYHAVVLLLHRPFVVLEQNDDDRPSLSRASELCTNAAKLAVDVARATPVIAIAKFGWNFAAYSVFQASLIHVYNCTSKDPTVSKQAKEYVDICINECLGPLSDDVPAGPPLIPFLQNLTSLLNAPDQQEITPPLQQQQQQNQEQQQQQQQPQQQQQHCQQQQRQQYQQQQQQNIPQQQQQTSLLFNNDYLQQDNKADSGSWLLNGGLGGNPALSQAAWQQLFSTAGPPFSTNDSVNRGFDVQGWDSFFTETQASNNMFLP